MEISEFELDFCARNGLPIPKSNLTTRLRELTYFRNRLFLYKLKCFATGKEMLSSFPSESGLKIACLDYWNSDNWHGTDFGRAYDFSKPFFEQFFDLFKQVPLPSLSNNSASLENCDFVNGVDSGKNCYLTFAAVEVEDILFSSIMMKCRDLVDCIYAINCELCFDCKQIFNCYQLRYSQECWDSRDSYFLRDCRSCSDCYGCVGLTNARFCVWNEQKSETEFRNFVSNLPLGSRTFVDSEKYKLRQLHDTIPIRYMVSTGSENVTGNFVNNSKDCFNSFYLSNSKEVEGGFFCDGAKDSVGAGFAVNPELYYCSTSSSNAYRIWFSLDVFPNTSDLEYCIYTTHGSNNCFGCVGLKKSSYCILNHQYSKEEYFEILPRIKRHMLSTGEYGQIFPKEYSPFYFNESDAGLLFPIEKEQAIQSGYRWKDNVLASSSAQLAPDTLPLDPSTLEGHEFRSKNSANKFKLTKAELAIYHKEQLPPPNEAPMERLRVGWREMALQDLKATVCVSCKSNIETIYSGHLSGVLCDKCYSQKFT